jgi:hypothetical protein
MTYDTVKCNEAFPCLRVTNRPLVSTRHAVSYSSKVHSRKNEIYGWVWAVRAQWAYILRHCLLMGISIQPFQILLVSLLALDKFGDADSNIRASGIYGSLHVIQRIARQMAEVNLFFRRRVSWPMRNSQEELWSPITARPMSRIKTITLGSANRFANSNSSSSPVTPSSKLRHDLVNSRRLSLEETWSVVWLVR